MPGARFFLLLCLTAAAAPAQTADATQLVEQLADTRTRSAAREGLIALGASAATPLAARVERASADHARACLEVLGELGPMGGAAVPTLFDVLRARRRGVDVEFALVATLAELIPFRDEEIEITTREQAIFRATGVRYGDGIFWTRLRERHRFPRGLRLDALLAVAAGHRALDVEVAIELLGARGTSAAHAVPLLRAVLDRPEPRILLTDARVPLHRKAAKALVAIAPDAPEATVARAVLAGTWSPPVLAEPPVPERARRRIVELLAELESSDPARRQAAADTLTALGRIAARPVATRLDPSAGAQTIDVALDVLRRLGRHGASAVPAIAEALIQLPADHTIAVMRTLGATAPWSTDPFPGPVCLCGVGRLVIQGHRIEGTVDVPFVNAFQAALTEMECAMTAPGDCSLEQLGVLLSDSSPGLRRRALEVIAARGAECAVLLGTLAAMLQEPQPHELVTETIAARNTRPIQVDRSDAIQRLAATAIVAAAPADHALVVKARERLAQVEAK